MSHNSWWSVNSAEDAFPMNRRSSLRIADTLTKSSRAVSGFAAITVACILVAITYVAAFGANTFDSMKGPFGSTSHLPSVAATLLGCGSVYQFDPKPEAYGVFDMQDLKPNVAGGKVRVPTAPPLVPAYGYMTDTPLSGDKVVYRVDDKDLPAMTSILRSMYSGTIVLWYLPTAGESGIKNLEEWATTHSNVVVMPWVPQTLGIPVTMTGYQMPAGRTYALSAWNVTQSCQGFGTVAANDFVDYVARLRGSNIPSASPPAAKVDKAGHLPSIEYAGSDIQ